MVDLTLYGGCRELILVKRDSFPACKLFHVIVATEIVRFHSPLFIDNEGCCCHEVGYLPTQIAHNFHSSGPRIF